MVYASTSEVYGDPEVHPQPESHTGNVNIRGPRGCYDESKRFGETLAVAYRKKYDVDVRTARVFNTFGPNIRPDDGRVVPTFIKQALSGDDLTIYGDGQATRSSCYVTDITRGLAELIDRDGLGGEAINIGRANEITIETLLDIVDSDSGIVYKELSEDDPQRRCPDLTKAEQLLDWDPTVTLAEGLERTIEAFRDAD
jgi:UDP-glucuronate decarboxylase